MHVQIRLALQKSNGLDDFCADVFDWNRILPAIMVRHCNCLVSMTYATGLHCDRRFVVRYMSARGIFSRDKRLPVAVSACSP